MQIKIFNEGQLDENIFVSLKDLLEAAFATTEAESATEDQSLDEWLNLESVRNIQPGTRLILGYVEGKLAGAAYIEKLTEITFPDGNKYDLVFLAVGPDFQKQGYGAELLRLAEIESLKAGADSLWLDTHIDLVGVHKFYLKSGYTESGVLTNYYENGDAKFFRKVLATH